MILNNYSWVNDFISLGYRIASSHHSNQKSNVFVISSFQRYISSLIAFGKVLFSLNNQSNQKNLNYYDFQKGDEFMIREGKKLKAVKIKQFFKNIETRESTENILEASHIELRDKNIIRFLPKLMWGQLSRATTSNKKNMVSHSNIDVNRSFVDSISENPNTFNELADNTYFENVIIGNRKAILEEVDQKILIPKKDPSNIGCIDDLVRYKNDSSYQHWRTIVESSSKREDILWADIIQEETLNKNPIGIIEGFTTYQNWNWEFKNTSLITICDRDKNSKDFVNQEIKKFEKDLNSTNKKFKILNNSNSEIITLNYEK